MALRLSLILVGIMLLLLPLTAWTVGVEMESRVGGGVALGTTDDDQKTGHLRWAAGAGLGFDVYLVKVSRLALGLATGVDYALLNYHGIADDVPTPAPLPPQTTDRISDSRYQYLNIPILLSAKLELPVLPVIVKAGAFFGYFLGGTTKLAYDPEIAIPGQDVYVDGEVDLDDSNTEQWQYGIRAVVGTELFSLGPFSFSPSLLFDLGFTDNSKDDKQPLPSKDTFWALTLNLGLRYRLF